MSGSQNIYSFAWGIRFSGQEWEFSASRRSKLGNSSSDIWFVIVVFVFSCLVFLVNLLVGLLSYRAVSRSSPRPFPDSSRRCPGDVQEFARTLQGPAQYGSPAWNIFKGLKGCLKDQGPWKDLWRLWGIFKGFKGPQRAVKTLKDLENTGWFIRAPKRSLIVNEDFV